MGLLNFLVIDTDIDLACPVTMISSFNSRPNTTYSAAACQMLRYLKGTTKTVLTYERNPRLKYTNEQLDLFSDTSLAHDPNTARLYRGYILFLYGSPIGWNAKRQSTAARSLCEAERVAASQVASQLSWCRNTLKELHENMPTSKCLLSCDNQPTLGVVEKPPVLPQV